MNTLTNEFYKGWQINRWLFYGISMPHIEDISFVSEVFYFIGIGNDRNVDVDDSDIPVSSCSGVATTKQTTLM